MHALAHLPIPVTSSSPLPDNQPPRTTVQSLCHILQNITWPENPWWPQWSVPDMFGGILKLIEVAPIPMPNASYEIGWYMSSSELMSTRRWCWLPLSHWTHPNSCCFSQIALLSPDSGPVIAHAAGLKLIHFLSCLTHPMDLVDMRIIPLLLGLTSFRRLHCKATSTFSLPKWHPLTLAEGLSSSPGSPDEAITSQLPFPFSFISFSWWLQYCPSPSLCNSNIMELSLFVRQ